MEDIAPWEADPRLAEPALMTLIRRLCDVRHEVVEALDRNKGDTAYSIGCVFHERSKTAICVDAGVYDWLSVVDPSAHFVFAVNGVPLRIFRAPLEQSVPHKARFRGAAERHAWQRLLFEEMYDDQAADWFWRVRLITDEDEEVTSVAFEELNEYGELRRRWCISADAIRAYVAAPNVRSMLRDPVDVPDVEIGLASEGVVSTASNDNRLLDGGAVLDGAGDGGTD